MAEKEEQPQIIITPTSEGISVKKYLGGNFWIEFIIKKSDVETMLGMIEREEAKEDDAQRVIQKPKIKLLTPDSF
jgi:hypothetical protein